MARRRVFSRMPTTVHVLRRDVYRSIAGHRMQMRSQWQLEDRLRHLTASMIAHRRTRELLDNQHQDRGNYLERQPDLVDADCPKVDLCARRVR